MNSERIKITHFKVTKLMCRKVKPVIKEGDTITISLSSKDTPNHGQYVLVSWNEYQWIEKYWAGLKKHYQNIYPITKVMIN